MNPPVARRLDVSPAVLRQLAVVNPRRYPALLESAVAGPLGKVTILAAQPQAALWSRADGRVQGMGMQPAAGTFLDALESWWRQSAVAETARESALQVARQTGVPFAPGWVVFLGYEVAADIEPHLRLPPTPLPWTAFALRTPCALVHVLASDSVWAVAEPGAQGLLDEVVTDAQRQGARVPLAQSAQPAFEVIEEDPARYLERVRRAQDYIRAGDIYQANLSRPWRVRPAAAAGAPAHAQALDTALLYERLRARNPAPFAALLQWDGVSVLSSSPERLLRVSGREVDTRPIAGTRPRTLRPGEDAPEAAALVAHPKERAEHIMLIDLERNDLGRVCEAGSVIVNELMVTETYAHVHHIVSNVQGRLREGVTPIGALRAVFPGGTITGCPKFRCMQVIAELEGAGRGAFYGSLGYLTPGGEMDLNILIRTMTVADSQITLRTGGGIVADSDPERELNETRAKARGMLAVFDHVP
ncbi:MAG TPA: aminodeoxychorismate synthase component I [Steroidobacteraceae bacterium]|nr:aminodeoxychorismate synthase component I [Steroidobacteraceae bacterium]